MCVGSRLQAEQVIDEALRAGVAAAEVHALIIEPAMARIGGLWESGAISVADEHLATAISMRVLPRLLEGLTTAPARSRERVLLAAVQGERHVLGLRLVADVLEGAGFEVLFLGEDVPFEALGRFVTKHQPAVTGLGFTVTTDVRHVRQAIGVVREASAVSRIMLGGPAVPPGLRDAGIPFVRSSLEVLRTVQTLLDTAPQPASGTGRALRPGSDHPRAGRRGAPDAPRLTPRELQVLQLSATGHPRRGIAEALAISEGTVKTHFEHIYRKLAVHDRASAVGHGIRAGLIH